MLYEIWGTSRSQKAVEKAMTLVDSLLNLPENVWVNIEFTEPMSDGSNGGCVECEEEDGYVVFDLDINKKQSVEQIVITLLHEMKHVEQYAQGRLGQDHWLSLPKPALPYEERPWEQEAFEFEKQAYERFRLLSRRRSL